jgi:hypothetical protein
MLFIERMTALAKLYDTTPSGAPATPDAVAAYSAFVGQVRGQFDRLPVEVVWTDDPAPYPTSNAMFRDIVYTGRLAVFTGGEDHPAMTRQENNWFRAVHDYYGHYLNCHSFSPLGEVRAWRQHMKMFTGIALHALTVETVGHTAWVNFGPHSHLPVKERPYAEQKANLLPEEVWAPLLV